MQGIKVLLFVTLLLRYHVASEPNYCSANIKWLSSSPLVRIFAAPRFLNPHMAGQIISIAEAQGLQVPQDTAVPPNALLDAAEHAVVEEVMRHATSELLGMPLDEVRTPDNFDPRGSSRTLQLRVRRTCSSDMHPFEGEGKAGVFWRHSDAMQYADGQVVVATIFLYLAEPPASGGATYFPDISMELRARMIGDVFVWYNCRPDGTLVGKDGDHVGSVVENGTKWTAILFAIGDPSYCAGYLPEPLMLDP